MEHLKTLTNKSQKAARVFRALNNSFRQRILFFLSGSGETDVTCIYKTLKLEQSVASQHLAILRKEAIVNARRDGKYIYYSINKERLREIETLADKLVAA